MSLRLTELELRAVPAVTATLGTDRVLRIVSDNGGNTDEEVIVNFAAPGQVQVLVGDSGDLFDTPTFVSINDQTPGGNSAVAFVPLGKILSISADLGANADSIALDPTWTKPTTLIGGAGDDSLTGGAGADLLRGGPGADVLVGAAGNDKVYGSDEANPAGDGADSLTGGKGIDLLRGGSGNDFVAGEDGNDDLDGQDGDDSLTGGKGNDKLVGGIGHDLMDGGDGVDVLEGGDGNDRLLGGPKNDKLAGQQGDDRLFGEAGADLVVGGEGSDSLFGGAGRDRFFGHGGPGYAATGDGKAATDFDTYQDAFNLDKPVNGTAAVGDIATTELDLGGTLAGLAAVANAPPDALAARIRHLGGGNYLVRMGDDTDVEVRFDGTWTDNDPMPSAAERLLAPTAPTEKSEFWTVLLARARLLYATRGEAVPYDPFTYYTQAEFDALTPSINDPGDAVEDITGLPGTQFTPGTPIAGLTNFADLQVLLATKTWVTVRSAAAPGLAGLPGGTEFAVVKAFTAGPIMYVTLYNPRGFDGGAGLDATGAKKDDGYITIQWDQLFSASNFDAGWVN